MILNINLYVYLCFCSEQSEKILTFETMLDSTMEIMEKNQRDYLATIENYKNVMIIYFTYPMNQPQFRSLNEMQENLFKLFEIKDSQDSIIAFMEKNSKNYNEFKSINSVNEFFKKIQAKMQNSDSNLKKISPNNSFGIKYVSNQETNVKCNSSTDKNDGYFEYFFDKKDSEYFNCTNNEFRFVEKQKNVHFSFFSNLKLSKSLFDLCLKFYDSNLQKKFKVIEILDFLL